MKVTQKQIRRFIKEELLKESGSAGDRAVGLYFDMEMHKDVVRALRGLYDNAMDAALEDLGDHLDAEEMVEAGMQTMLAEFLQAYGRGS